MHSRVASRLAAGRFNQHRLQCECTAARHLGFDVSISTGFNVNAQPRGIPASSWSLISAPVSTWGCITTPYKNPYPGMLLSLYFFLSLYHKHALSLCYRKIFLVSFLHRKQSKPNTDMSRLNLTARGYYTVPRECTAVAPPASSSSLKSPPASP